MVYILFYLLHFQIIGILFLLGPFLLKVGPIQKLLMDLNIQPKKNNKLGALKKLNCKSKRKYFLFSITNLIIVILISIIICNILYMRLQIEKYQSSYHLN